MLLTESKSDFIRNLETEKIGGPDSFVGIRHSVASRCKRDFVCRRSVALAYRRFDKQPDRENLLLAVRIYP